MLQVDNLNRELDVYRAALADVTEVGWASACRCDLSTQQCMSDGFAIVMRVQSTFYYCRVLTRSFVSTTSAHQILHTPAAFLGKFSVQAVVKPLAYLNHTSPMPHVCLTSAPLYFSGRSSCGPDCSRGHRLGGGRG